MSEVGRVALRRILNSRLVLETGPTEKMLRPISPYRTNTWNRWRLGYRRACRSKPSDRNSRLIRLFILAISIIPEQWTRFTITSFRFARRILGPQAPIFSLCENHDMYSGGGGYYWLIDKAGQGAGYFCLRNDK